MTGPKLLCSVYAPTDPERHLQHGYVEMGYADGTARVVLLSGRGEPPGEVLRLPPESIIIHSVHYKYLSPTIPSYLRNWLENYVSYHNIHI